MFLKTFWLMINILSPIGEKAVDFFRGRDEYYVIYGKETIKK